MFLNETCRQEELATNTHALENKEQINHIVLKNNTSAVWALEVNALFSQALTKFLNLYDFLYLEPHFHVVPWPRVPQVGNSGFWEKILLVWYMAGKLFRRRRKSLGFFSYNYESLNSLYNTPISFTFLTRFGWLLLPWQPKRYRTHWRFCSFLGVGSLTMGC